MIFEKMFLISNIFNAIKSIQIWELRELWMIQEVSCNKSAYVSTVFNYELIINQLLMIQVLQEHRFSESIRASTNSMVGSCVSGSPVPVEWRILRCRWLQVRVDWHFFGKLSILMYSPMVRTFQHILSQEMTDKYLSLRSISSCMFSLLQRGLKIHHCIRHCFMRRSSLKMTKLVGARCNMV